jgi:hypothetical protein
MGEKGEGVATSVDTDTFGCWLVGPALALSAEDPCSARASSWMKLSLSDDGAPFYPSRWARRRVGQAQCAREDGKERIMLTDHRDVRTFIAGVASMDI